MIAHSIGALGLVVCGASLTHAQETATTLPVTIIAQAQNTATTEAGSSSLPSPGATVTPTPGSPDAAAILKEEESQRMLGLRPNFGTTNHMDAPALSSGQKFHLFYRAALDPWAFASTGLQAGISQAEDEFPGYGQGASGYAKRYGATFADSFSSNFFANFLYPVLLKEDPRYFRLGHGSFKHRLFYAAEQEIICHKDRGGRGFAWDNVLGAFSSGTLSNIYYPSTDRGIGLTLSRSTISLAYGGLGNLVSEFWPDISHALFKKHKKSDTDTTPAP